MSTFSNRHCSGHHQPTLDGRLVLMVTMLLCCVMQITAMPSSPFVREQDHALKEIIRALKDPESTSRRQLTSSGGASSGDIERSVMKYISMKGDELLLVEIISNVGNAGTTLLNAVKQAAPSFDETACSDYVCAGYLNVLNSEVAALELLTEVSEIKPVLTYTTGSSDSDSDDSCRTVDEFGAGEFISRAIFAHDIDRVVEADSSLDGSGVKVCVLSDSYNAFNAPGTPATDAAADVQSGDLPADVDVVQEGFGSNLVDEGRAMLQAIHDIAPGASLAFHTAKGGIPAFAAAIRKLATPAVGCDVIVDNFRITSQPFFQIGPVAQAANEVVEVNGIPYFSSVGNIAAQSWEGMFKDSLVRGSDIDDIVDRNIAIFLNCRFHDFGGGNIFQDLSFSTDQSFPFTFQWDEPFKSVSGTGSSNEIDILIFDETGQTLQFITLDLLTRNFGNDPIEESSSLSGRFKLAICLNEGPEPGMMKWISLDPNVEADPPADSSTVFGHPNQVFTAAVGAAFDQQALTAAAGFDILAERFSSLGGTPLLIDESGNRLPEPIIPPQPRFVGADGSLNSFFGSEIRSFNGNGGLYPNESGFLFFGTSASAPNVAAIAALMLQAKPDLEPLEIYEILEETAIDMNEEGFDFLTGFGFVDGFEAVKEVAKGKFGKGGSSKNCRRQRRLSTTRNGQNNGRVKVKGRRAVRGNHLDRML